MAEMGLGAGRRVPPCLDSPTGLPPSTFPAQPAPRELPHLPPGSALSENRGGTRRGAQLLPGTLGKPRHQRGAGHELQDAGKALLRCAPKPLPAAGSGHGVAKPGHP